jgi:urea transport system ATP-binding protein
VLSHGQNQWLEIGMLLMQDPQLLLIDEPAAGMTDAETEATAMLLRETVRHHSVVVVEHDMAFVRASIATSRCCTRARRWPRGRSTVQANPQVMEVYLGR